MLHCRDIVGSTLSLPRRGMGGEPPDCNRASQYVHILMAQPNSGNRWLPVLALGVQFEGLHGCFVHGF